jgi:hypothetical protein
MPLVAALALTACGPRTTGGDSSTQDAATGAYPIYVALSSWASPDDSEAYSVFVASPLDLAPGVQLCFGTPQQCLVGQGVRLETNRRTNDAGVVYFRAQKYARLAANTTLTVLAATTAGQTVTQVVQIVPKGAVANPGALLPNPGALPAGYPAGTTNPYVANPYATNPYATNPYAANPYATNPYATNPYATNPYATNPYAVATPRPYTY